MRAKWKSQLLIITLIVLVSMLHYTGKTIDPTIHGFYRLLYYIPIILAGFLFGFRGGVLASILVSLIYSPLNLLRLGELNLQGINEFLDVILFFTVGIITGTLVEKKNISLQRLDTELKRYVLLESYTNSIIESIQSGVIAVNNDLLITMINQGAKEILDVQSECIGQNFMEVFHCCEKVKEYIQRVVNHNLLNQVMELGLNSRGKDRVVRVSVFPLTLEGMKKGLVIIIDEITEVKKLQEQLLRSEKLAALGELSTGIAHEIRNPLGIIKAIEQTMQHELKDDQEAVQELKMIDEEIERANRVVKSLMDFGRPALREKDLISVQAILEDVLAITHKYITQHQVRVEFIPEENGRVIADKEQIKQAFINIIFNAVQAMPTGGQLTIITESENGSDWSKIIFEDTGVGISPEHMEKIFNPFFTTKAEGTGLGLSIVHRIVEEHGGLVHVTSVRDVGTRFEIWLPLEGEGIDEEDSDRGR